MRKTDLRWLRLPALVRAVALLGEQHGGLELDDPDAICLALGVHPEERDTFLELAMRAANVTEPQTGNAARCRRRRERERIAAMSQGMSLPMSEPMSNTHVEPMSQGMSNGGVCPLSLSLGSVSSHSSSLSAEDLQQSAGAGARGAGTATMSLDHVAKPKRERVNHQNPKTTVPADDASPEEIEAFCAKWKLPPPSDPRVQRFLDVYRKDETYWRNWSAVWREFLKRQAKWDANGSGGRRDVQKLTGTEEFMKKVGF